MHFHNWNIVSDCTSENLAQLDHPSLCVSDSLKELNHENKVISWLKIDCEGCEFSVIPKFMESSIETHQIMVEMHFSNAVKIAGLYRVLYGAGMMIFHKERNQWGC